MSIDRRASSPALARRPSTTSLRGGYDSPGASNSPRLLNKRSSSNLLLSQLMPSVEEPAPPTAGSVASEFFAGELAVHKETGSIGDGTIGEKTVVIIHDDCYGHRFSRMKTKDSILSIFERPERVQASVMGISAAYVRLGDRFADGISNSKKGSASTKALPFRIVKSSRKVRLQSDVVTAVHGKEWMKELQGLCNTAGQKVSSATIELERTPNFNGTKKEAFHSGDLYLCEESIKALEGALGGVCDAVDAVFQGSASGTGPTQAFACVRPPGHHCSSDWPSGFCWLNNVHVGIQHAIQTYGLTHAAIIDFDLHHGDGSQEITWAHNERMQFPKAKNFPNSKKSFLGYFSLHDINSFPCELGDREKTQMASLCIDNAHGQAIWNVHLEQYQSPEEFWDLYETRYKVILDKVRKFLKYRTNELRSWKNSPVPKAAIFISAGFDASEHEVSYMQRHSVNVMTEFYARFTRDIVELANEEGTAAGGRVISVLEGGYSDKALISGVLSHISGLCEGNALAQEDLSVNDVMNGQGSLGISGLAAAPLYGVPQLMKYNNEWWHDSNLDALVHLLHPPASAADKAAVKKSRNGTYSSPTHASVMKAVDPNRVLIRASSMSSRATSLSPSRAESPPLPEVDWATATSELCKLLIPSDRQINSLTQADLNPPKDVKIKKEREVDVATEMVAVNGRALRERKPRISVGPEAQPIAVRSRKASIDRRKTLSDVPLPSVETSERPKEPRRRTSIASTVSASSAAPIPNARARTTKSTAAALDVKKTRTSTSASSSRATSVKPPAVPRIPSGVVKREGSATSNGSVPTVKQTSDTDMDSLTSGFQRIKIKVPSNEEYQARQTKVPLVSAARTTTVAAKKPVVSRATKAPATTVAKKPSARETARAKATMTSTTAATKASIPRPLAIVSPPMAPAPVHGRFNGSLDLQVGHNGVNGAYILVPQQTSSLPSQLSMASPPMHPTSQGMSSPISSVSPTTPQPSYPNLQWAVPNADVPKGQPPQPLASNQFQEFQWMPPNSDTAAVLPGQGPPQVQPSDVVKTQKPMPTFSATGHIPFADMPFQQKQNPEERRM
jgi:histone deacetylase HOS3